MRRRWKLGNRRSVSTPGSGSSHRNTWHSAKRRFGAVDANSARLCERNAVILGCMELSRPPLVVAFELSEKRKAIVADALAGASAVVYLTELDEAARAEALRN